MSFFERVTRSFRDDQAEERNAFPGAQVSTSNKPYLASSAAGGNTYAGVNVSQNNALQLNAVMTCVRIVSDAVATLPVDVVQTVGDKRRPVNAPSWLSNPNPFDTPVEFWFKVMSSLMLDGNAFIRVVRAGNSRIVAMLPMNPRAIRVDLSEDKTHPVFKFDDVTMTSRDVLHIKGFAVASDNGLRGVSPIDEARQLIGAGMAVEEFGARFFSQGTSLTGVIEHPGKANNGELATIGRMMRKKHSGLANSHIIGILGGGATFKPISVTPEQSQFLETQKFNRASIAALFGVPVYMLDPETASSWGSGVEEQHNWFVQQTVQPWLTRIEQAFSAVLPPGQSLRFNPDARVRVKLKERYEAHEIGIRAGFLTVNEARALEDREPLPESKQQNNGVNPARDHSD
ncbi:phage portal protein [Actinoplanes sp. NPDC048988]|uniref:phage portal protein n=1 Tax=Actinoplanes sp. NPDC048988 TaxID=3363901 RepID=UPI003715E831